MLRTFVTKESACFCSNVVRLQKFRSFSLYSGCRASESPKQETDFSELEIDEDKELEIEKKRNKNRLPERIYKVFVLKEPFTPEMKFEFTKKNLRKHYGKYGKCSGLNPGILWPTRAELHDIIEYEKMFHRPLQETQEKIRLQQETLQTEQREYEEYVDKNMSKHDQWLKEYHDKIEIKRKQAEEAKQKRQHLIEEISEYLGYDVDPSDPKFKEAVEKRDKEVKKASRARKQEESYNKLLHKLTEVAEKIEEKEIE